MVPNTSNSIKVPHLPQENVVLFWGQPFLIVLGSRAVQSFWWQRILEFEAHIMRWKSHETLKPHWNWTSSKISKTCKEGWSVHMARVYNPCEYQLASLIHVGMPCDHRYVGVVSGFHLSAAMSQKSEVIPTNLTAPKWESQPAVLSFFPIKLQFERLKLTKWPIFRAQRGLCSERISRTRRLSATSRLRICGEFLEIWAFGPGGADFPGCRKLKTPKCLFDPFCIGVLHGCTTEYHRRQPSAGTELSQQGLLDFRGLFWNKSGYKISKHPMGIVHFRKGNSWDITNATTWLVHKLCYLNFMTIPTIPCK